MLALTLGSSEAGATLAALAYGFATMAMVYARSFYAEPLMALIITATFYLAFADKTHSLAVFSGLAILAKPTTLFLGPIITVYLLAKRRPLWRALLPTAGTCAAGVLYLGYNYYRFENAFNVHGSSLGVFAPSLSNVPLGVAGMLVSPGFGFLWFNPCVILAIFGMWKTFKSKPLEVLATLALFGTFLLIHSPWPFWNGGWSWGPRYLLPLLPCTVAFAGIVAEKYRREMLVLMLAGFLLTAPTLVTSIERYLAESTEAGISYQALMWRPRYSPLLHEWPAAARQIRDARKNNVVELSAARGAPATVISSSRALRIVAVWWWILPIVHIPWVVGFLVACALVAVGVLIILPEWPAKASHQPATEQTS